MIYQWLIVLQCHWSYAKELSGIEKGVHEEAHYRRIRIYLVGRELSFVLVMFVYQKVSGLFPNDNVLPNSEIHFSQKSAWTIFHKSPSKLGTLKF